MRSPSERNRLVASLERRIVLEPTVKIISGLLAAVIGLAAVTANADFPLVGQSPSNSAVQATGQAGDVRHQSDDLLKRARQAMEEGDLSTAEKIVADCESLGVQYGTLHFGDTPSKVRADIEKRRKALPATTPVDPFAASSSDRDDESGCCSGCSCHYAGPQGRGDRTSGPGSKGSRRG